MVYHVEPSCSRSWIADAHRIMTTESHKLLRASFLMEPKQTSTSSTRLPFTCYIRTGDARASGPPEANGEFIVLVLLILAEANAIDTSGGQCF